MRSKLFHAAGGTPAKRITQWASKCVVVVVATAALGLYTVGCGGDFLGAGKSCVSAPSAGMAAPWQVTTSPVD